MTLLLRIRKRKRLNSCFGIALLFVAFLFCGLSEVVASAKAEGKKVAGKVVFESSEGKFFSVSSARVSLAAGKDTLNTISSADGYFRFDRVPFDKVTLRVSHVSYQSFENVVELEAGDNFFFVKLDLIPLDVASVVADVSPVSHRGDTVVFNASAVRTMEGDNAVEILRQMPGVEFRNGKIFVDGHEVKRTYVNGKLIFGNGVMTPLNSLLAEDVVNIKSYEEQTQDAKEQGLINSKKNRVLDVTTKNPVFSAFDGYAVASAGADGQKSQPSGEIQGRYVAGLNANFFSEMFLAYVNAYANNVGWEGNNFASYNNLPGALDSYNEKASVKAGFEKYWGDRLLFNMLGASYSFSKGYTRSQSESMRDYFATEDSPSRSFADLRSASSYYGRHDVTLDGSINTRALGTVLTKHKLVLENSGSDDLSRSVLSSSGENETKQNRLQSSFGDSRFYEGSLFWTKNNFSSGFFPMLYVSARVGRDEKGGSIVDLPESSFTQICLSNEGSDKDFRIDANLSVNKVVINNQRLTFTLNPGYGFSRYRNSRINMAFDVLDKDNPVIDNVNSYDYTWNVVSHGPGIKAVMAFSGNNLTVTPSVRFCNVIDNESFPVALDGNYRFVVPNLVIDYNSKNVHAHFESSGNLPSAEHLRDRIDDRDAFYLKAGNPALRSERRNQLTVSAALVQGKTNRLSFEGDFQINARPIVLRQKYFLSDEHLTGWGGYDAKAGSTLTTWENAPLSVSVSPVLKYSDRIQKHKINLNFQVGALYQMRPQYISDRLVNLHEIVPSFEARVGYSPSRITRLSVTGRVGYVHSSNSIGLSMPDMVTSGLGFSGRVQFLKFFLARLEYSFNAHNYLSHDFSDMYINRLDALVSVSLLKGRMGISISGNDLLSRGNSLSIINDANYRSMTWTPSWGRYFMLSVSYRFNRTSSKTSFIGALVKG